MAVSSEVFLRDNILAASSALLKQPPMFDAGLIIDFVHHGPSLRHVVTIDAKLVGRLVE